MKKRRPTVRQLVIAIGVALIALGAFLLYYSEALAPANSWQANTLDAFGVGLVVGGAVDVAAIAGLDWIAADFAERQQERRRDQRQLQLIVIARQLLEQKARPSKQELEDVAWQIDHFVDRDGDLIYANYRHELWNLAMQLRAKSGAPVALGEHADDAPAASP